MLHFTIAEDSTFHLPNPNSPLYQLEYQVDRLSELHPTQRLPLLYNDAHNYRMTSLSPTSEWFAKRIRWIQTYAALDWLGLGEHLNRKSMTLGNLCTTIYRQLQELVTERAAPSFSVAAFCTVLGKIDHLWQIVLPSHLEGIESPTVLALLEEFGRRAS